jgi:hypothetical protein
MSCDGGVPQYLFPDLCTAILLISGVAEITGFSNCAWLGVKFSTSSYGTWDVAALLVWVAATVAPWALMLAAQEVLAVWAVLPSPHSP